MSRPESTATLVAQRRERDEVVRGLRRAAPRSAVVRGSVVVGVLAIVAVWLFAPFALVEVTLSGEAAGVRLGESLRDTFDPQRGDNLARFITRIAPRPEQGQTVWGWLLQLLSEKGLRAVATTLAVALAAAGIAALIALPAAFAAARNVSTPDPFGLGGPRPIGMTARLRWQLQVSVARISLAVLRALPEYLLAFVLVVLGPGAWPAVLALALHNGGILGRLGAEVTENVDAGPARFVRAAGAGRWNTTWFVVLPQVFPRFLLFFFYRLESCVRESVVLGMLGVGTLGYLIQNDARARLRYDEMIVYLVLAGVLVVVGDVVSSTVRRRLRAG